RRLTRDRPPLHANSKVFFTDSTNLVYSNARYLNPAQGQFVTQDPVFWALKMNLNNPQSLNAYSYALDNPINKHDPDRLAATLAQKIAVIKAQLNYLQGVVSLYQGGFTQQANTAFAVYQTVFGGGQSGTQQGNSSVTNSRSNIAGSSAQVPNISMSLN